MRKIAEEKDKLEPAKESPETRALKRFFPQGRGRLEGKIVRGFFGPDSPEVREVGGMQSKWIMGGLFCVFTWDEWTSSGAKKVNPIHGYCIVGWDSRDGEYRMLRAANLGVLHQLNGRLDGNRLAFVSDEALIKGKPTRIRYTLTWKRRKVIVWVGEWSVRGGPWKKISESHLIYA
ncbi:MAG: hypothetical protein A3K60_03020 [Euryarchaeota archaeon RBG_19FT_COMBO_56_21]|jgi:hypothetical protein|nr:MAG: hypothetical protein A3K60_03020 [Euryarchaeota archaeon RBG_19FT_COMBO_56_21]